MVITKDFIFIHLPKTGGTFVTKILKEVYQYNGSYVSIKNKLYLRYRKIWNNELIPNTNRQYGQHGGCNQIPTKYKNLPIVSIIRNPFDRYVSQYEFGWWKKYSPIEKNVMINEFPNYPDLSFNDYLKYLNNILIQKLLKGFKPKINIGIMTYQFVLYYFKNPIEVLKNLDENYLKGNYINDLYRITFLRQQNLNEDLYNLLLQNGFAAHKIDFIKNSKKIYPKEGGRMEYSNWKDYYDKDHLKIILNFDSLIFNIFPEYSIF